MAALTAKDMSTDLGECDYLVIGGGAASFAFVDTLLIEQPSAQVIMVDGHAAPGGHWNDDYGYVQLHQPSMVYGVQSKLLEGSWLGLAMKGVPFWGHRASKLEILAYYQSLVDEWTKGGQVRFFGKSNYDFSRKEEFLAFGVHQFVSQGPPSQAYYVKVNVKLVNGTLGENAVPSKTPVQFPVDKGVTLITPNELFDQYGNVKPTSKCCGSSNAVVAAEDQQMKYVVMGAGKTGMDCIVFLQRNMGVPANSITWIISRGVWIINRDKSGLPELLGKALVKSAGNRAEALEALEAKGLFTRIQNDVPTAPVRYPTLGNDEIKLLKNIRNQIQRGRITKIALDGEQAKVEFGAGHEPLTIDSSSTFVHCTSPGPFVGKAVDIFSSSKEINLQMLLPPPVTISMSMIAKIESTRRKGTLELAFGQTLLAAMPESRIQLEAAKKASDPLDEIMLKTVIKAFDVPNPDRDETVGLQNLAMFAAILDSDPSVGLKWLKSNRLSTLSIPGSKGEFYEFVSEMIQNQDKLGYSEDWKGGLPVLQEKLKLIKGT